MSRCWRRSKSPKVQGFQDPGVPRSQGLTFKYSHSNMSLTLKKVHLVKFIFINVYKNAKEKLSLGFWVKKSKLTMLELVSLRKVSQGEEGIQIFQNFWQHYNFDKCIDG